MPTTKKKVIKKIVKKPTSLAEPRKTKTKKRFGNTQLGTLLLVLVMAVVLVFLFANNYETPISDIKFPPLFQINNNQTDLVKFDSEEDFKTYLANSEESLAYAPQMVRNESFGMDSDLAIPMAEKSTGIGSGGGNTPDRYSQTNVQVMGIDEPDIVKTDGQTIYFSHEPRYYYGRGDVFIEEPMPISGKEIALPVYDSGTDLITAWPPADLEIADKIDHAGNLLLADDTLLVLSQEGDQTIYAYNKNNAEEKWNIKLDDDHYLQTARQYGDKIYIIARKYTNRHTPCPLRPLTIGGNAIEIACTDVYHPIASIDASATYSVFKIDINSGKIDDQISFVGSAAQSIVYMSPESLYVTYPKTVDLFAFTLDFMINEADDIFGSEVIARLKKLNSYDISSQAKMTEFQTIMMEWNDSLDSDKALWAENEMTNRMDDYSEKNKRNLEQTNIVKIAIKNLKIKSSGSVPGALLNQFSLDEYDNHLRIATTVGGRWFSGWSNTSESSNDVYILDKNLKTKGSILDLGVTERIYSARFIGDKGYLVTFRQIDPFYVLDLSNPKSPHMSGELKIPGYSSYLHPIDEDTILGIGMEDRQVKISLFDVSDPNNPKEIDKYMLDEYGSEALHNHHAFLLDDKHKVFFLPAYQGGYIFSYENNEISLTKAIADYEVKRALYIDDYFYILAEDAITVLNENDWTEVNNLDLLDE